MTNCAENAAVRGRSGARRVLVKLSGEALKGARAGGISFRRARLVARDLVRAGRQGTQMAVVIGGGNLIRGRSCIEDGMDRVVADRIGMLGTVMNALALAEAVRSESGAVLVQSAIPVPGADPFERDRAVSALEEGRIVVLAGGTGHPFFTTDTTAALRAAELGVDLLLKATKVDGVFSADPLQDPDAVRFRTLSWDDVIERRLAVMDATAFSLCRETGMRIVVFNYARRGELHRALAGDLQWATLVGDVPTQVDDGYAPNRA